MASQPSPRHPDPGPGIPSRVLIVEDHDLTRRFLADNLAADGYDPLEAGSMARARQLIAAERPAVAVLDLGLSDGDGLALLGELRRPGSELDPELPVLILSGRVSELDRVRGLERGADDYLGKPFSYQELRLRLAALVRRTAGRATVTRIQVRSLELDPRSREVWIRGGPVHLSRKEFALLRLLASAPTRTFTRPELLREVWGVQTAAIKTRTLDSHAHRLRSKLSAPTDGYIVNVWGVGYRLIDPGGSPVITAALCGWIAAAVATALALAVRHTLDDGREAVARACHELRGPLTAARLGLSLQPGGDEASRERLRAIDTELRRAALALDDLAVAPRGEWGRPRLGELERLDLRALVVEAVEAARGRALAAGVTLHRVPTPGEGARSDAIVWGDRLRLAQALGNLIANAIEHGGASVRVVLVTRPETTRIEVCDGGPGLPAPVAQLASRPRRGRGSRGRGLAIAQAIADRHGGTLSAAPALTGARLVLELPVVATQRRDDRAR